MMVPALAAEQDRSVCVWGWKDSPAVWQGKAMTQVTSAQDPLAWVPPTPTGHNQQPAQEAPHTCPASK